MSCMLAASVDSFARLSLSHGNAGNEDGPDLQRREHEGRTAELAQASSLPGSSSGDPKDSLSHDFEQRLTDICGSISDVEERCIVAEVRAQDAEAEAHDMHERLADAQADLAILIPRLAETRSRNQELEEQVDALQAQLAKCHSDFSDVASLAGLLDRERIEKARLQTALSTAQIERESALTDLAGAYSDMQAMQAALLDSALYVRFLRAKLLELQLAQHQMGAQPGDLGSGARDSAAAAAPFSFERTKKAIQDAIKEASQLEKSECMKRVKQLRLRWHPDKNPELQEFASEVTKIINMEVEALQLTG